jgi:hypothetical protein
MGLGFTIDSPIKVAKFGISSVISIIDDQLIEQMRKFYGKEHYEPITSMDVHHRSKRITAYLNLVKNIVTEQINQLREQAFDISNDIAKYFEMLPEKSPLSVLYQRMISVGGNLKLQLQNELRSYITPGNIDVNIMTKVDKQNLDKNGESLPSEFSDALTSLKGYAESDVASSIIFSAGLNPRLFSYCTTFEDFYPDKEGQIKKKITLKVSDFRSASIQGRFLAKKGLYVSEFRVESGLNCGGHAFASNGLLLGPVLEEFKQNKALLQKELYEMCLKYWEENGHNTNLKENTITLSAQGGVGTSEEHELLLNKYQIDSVGWGSPFLLVPEAVSIEKETMHKLANAKEENYYLSHASPLGVPFNNFKESTSIELQQQRIAKNRPGSPCYKKYLSFNTEFTETPICVASRQYQHKKLNEISDSKLSESDKEKASKQITEKECLCEGLSASSLLNKDINPAHNLKAVSVCPGPNLAYFSGVFSLSQMIGHIYGRENILNQLDRPHVFVKEIRLNLKFLKEQIERFSTKEMEAKTAYIRKFKNNLTDTIGYYRTLFKDISLQSEAELENIYAELRSLEKGILGLGKPVEILVSSN